MVVNLRAKCFYDDIHFLKCFNNDNGICRTIYQDLKSFMLLFHKFDGKNYIKCLCG